MTVVNLRQGGQGEDCAQIMSHQSPFVLYLFSILLREIRGQAPRGLSPDLPYSSSSQSHSMTCIG